MPAGTGSAFISFTKFSRISPTDCPDPTPVRYVRDHPDARVADLASAFAVGVGTTSKIVDRMEKEGWMERRPNPANRRSSLLALTPAGESVVSRAEPAWQAAIQDILDRAVTAAELTALSLVLAALRSDLERRHLGLPAG
jgi:MarR family multiple antibiotic resistance transcriptional regulator